VSVDAVALSMKQRSGILSWAPEPRHRGPLEILCVGAHCDDIEIGCGATLLRLAEERPVSVTWVVLSGSSARQAEAERSARSFLAGTRRQRLLFGGFRDGYFPSEHAAIKELFERLKQLPVPDLVFTHEPNDLHQDHRIAAELTWNTFRNHAILEYEIPKYDGGLGQPNVYAPVTAAHARRKARYLLAAYATQRAKRWFTEDTFRALLRLRGVECNAASGLAEAFHGRKVII
jgi:LmbE family N-acetylglucosaminyl deacetylase